VRKAPRELITDYFNKGLIKSINPGPLRGPVRSVRLKRDKAADLILTTTSDGWPSRELKGDPAGTVRQSTETIEFTLLGGGRGIGRGVIPRGQRSLTSRNGATVTIEKCSLQSIEIDLERTAQSVFLIEWIDNLSDHFMWPDLTDYKKVTQSTESFGSPESLLTITRSGEAFSGGRSALHLLVAGIELYVVKDRGKGKRKKRNGRIIYRSNPDQKLRDKIRECLSFVFGLPIVYSGHTEYCAEWIPTRERAVDAFSIDGRMFALHEQPPFPVFSRYDRMLDGPTIAFITNILVKNYDSLKFLELSWSYWHAVCAPTHNAAAQFGAVIELLQKASVGPITQVVKKGMLDEELWRNLSAKMREALMEIDVQRDIRSILKSRIDNLNQAPPNYVLKRLFEQLGLALGEVEIDAWKHRNMAAHGHLPKDPLPVILNTKALRVLFHRMLAGATYCSDSYIDYYSLHFPTRALNEPIPHRGSQT
jgi:hypothetical protein